MLHIGKTFISGIFIIALLQAHKPGTFTVTKTLLRADTTIGMLLMGNELAGADQRKRATAYFLLTGGDSSAFRCYFSETKKSEMMIDIKTENTGISWKQRLAELTAILPYGSKAYFLDSLKNISIGRLVHTAELSPLITADYRKYFGKTNKVPANSWINKLLLQSRLTSDLNLVFKPYKMAVAGYDFEKLSFVTTERGKEFDGVVTARMKMITN